MAIYLRRLVTNLGAGMLGPDNLVRCCDSSYFGRRLGPDRYRIFLDVCIQSPTGDFIWNWDWFAHSASSVEASSYVGECNGGRADFGTCIFAHILWSWLIAASHGRSITCVKPKINYD
jgi:hypothetical protein